MPERGLVSPFSRDLYFQQTDYSLRKYVAFGSSPLSTRYSKYKITTLRVCGHFIFIVPERGLEPPHLAIRDFESRASTIPPLRHNSLIVYIFLQKI